MIEQKLEELRYYFTGYGSPHDETILKMIEQNKRYRKFLKKITNKAFIQDYCDKHDIYEYEAMYDLANEALEGEE